MPPCYTHVREQYGLATMWATSLVLGQGGNRWLVWESLQVTLTLWEATMDTPWRLLTQRFLFRPLTDDKGAKAVRDSMCFSLLPMIFPPPSANLVRLLLLYKCLLARYLSSTSENSAISPHFCSYHLTLALRLASPFRNFPCSDHGASTPHGSQQRESFGGPVRYSTYVRGAVIMPHADVSCLGR